MILKISLPVPNTKEYHNLFSILGKYLFLSAGGHEIVDFLNPNTKYQLLANNVPRVSRATGGLLQNSPIERPFLR